MRRFLAPLALLALTSTAIAASAPSPTFNGVTATTLNLAGTSLSGVAATADAQAGTSAALLMTPATTRASTTSQLSGLPTTMPTTVGALWNNGGLISVVQP